MNALHFKTRWKELTTACVLAASPWWTHAMEISSGDAEPLPDGATAVLVYAQHAERKSLYADGNKLPGDNRLESDAALLRVVHAKKLANGAVIEPQFILPYVRLDAGGDMSALGEARGVGDLILASPIKFVLGTALGDVLSFVPAVSLPTGRYHSQDALNAGENRWGAILQLAYVHRFTPDWLLDSSADITLYADNDEYGPQNATYEQKPRYEFQSYLAYKPGPATRLSFGFGHITGGQTSVDGVDQGSASRTTYGRIALSHFVTATTQLQLKLGRDLSVRQGFKEDQRLELRLATIF